jgi:hypothetical protein
VGPPPDDLAWQYAPDSWAVLQAQSSGNNGNTCQGGAGTSSVHASGVSWLVKEPTTTGQPDRASQLPNDNATACTPQPADGLYAYADLKLNTTGAAKTGGITGVLNHLTLLGPDATAWTSSPLGG